MKRMPPALNLSMFSPFKENYMCSLNNNDDTLFRKWMDKSGSRDITLNQVRLNSGAGVFTVSCSGSIAPC